MRLMRLAILDANLTNNCSSTSSFGERHANTQKLFFIFRTHLIAKFDLFILERDPLNESSISLSHLQFSTVCV